ncbi:MAG: 1-(5-phosphoribosyl)-5-[(5-phosphoribosylamino)methylideneamino]imidazole-4-carboxamide isomerase [Chloroflexi bacterium]|nr:1-(5-phosphoribosyl)-5-[(5-phosphoribosylamino)methylideneamino]imidazole-4-carboxamide isomerase [Chloroflexota bacterium]
MIIFPAIDLRNGRVVRLQQGRAEAETKYSDDPASVAVRWQDEGAHWLHVVNLDGAFGEHTGANLRALEKILATVEIPVQFGGGLRDLASIQAAFDRGVSRVVIGTAAIENPALVSEILNRFGSETIAVGIDARDGMVATRGWVEKSKVSAIELAREMRERGIERIIYTDIARDGMLQGVNAEATAQLARACGLAVIASGGVASVRDVESLRAFPEIEGVIIGQALYTGAVSLNQVLEIVNSAQ